ncbi:hypothetical protein BDZ91DRAFT_720591 [Kalaharituber pfeilii]|nr:hypothetical protein BDZ91DRAFT_720591 [Kalaharituber pfeilii]
MFIFVFSILFCGSRFSGESDYEVLLSLEVAHVCCSSFQNCWDSLAFCDVPSSDTKLEVCLRVLTWYPLSSRSSANGLSGGKDP